MKKYLPKGWLQVLKREFALMQTRSTYRMIFFVFPLLAISFFVLFFWQGVPTGLPIAIVDNDRTALSRRLTQMIDAAPTPEVTFVTTNIAEAQQKMHALEVYGIVVIPTNFSHDLMRGMHPQVQFLYNNVYLVPGGMLNKDIGLAVNTLATGFEINVLKKRAVSSDVAMAMALPVKLDNRQLFNPYTNYYYYLAIAFIPIMLLMFILSGTVYVIGSEFKYGRAGEWLSDAQGSIFRALSAKLLPYVIILTAFVFIVNYLIIGVYGTPLKGSIPILMYASLLFVLAYVSMGILIVALFPSLRMALSIAAIYGALAFTMSGLTFPHEAMYKPIVFIAQLFPLTHYLKVFIDQTLRGAPVVHSFYSLIALNLFLFPPFLILPRLKKMCSDSKYWGKQ